MITVYDETLVPCRCAFRVFSFVYRIISEVQRIKRRGNQDGKRKVQTSTALNG